MSDTRKVLVIDDEPDNIAYLTAVLEDNNFETLSAPDGEEGLKKAKETPPDLILLDLMMPRKSGVKFLNEIKQHESLRLIPIIVQSGASKETGVNMKEFLEKNPFKDRKAKVLGEGQDTAPDAYLEKPVDPGLLIETIKKLL